MEPSNFGSIFKLPVGMWDVATLSVDYFIDKITKNGKFTHVCCWKNVQLTVLLMDNMRSNIGRRQRQAKFSWVYVLAVCSRRRLFSFLNVKRIFHRPLFQQHHTSNACIFSDRRLSLPVKRNFLFCFFFVIHFDLLLISHSWCQPAVTVFSSS